MSALAAPACAFAPPPSVLPRHPCGECPLSRVDWPRLTTGAATLDQNNRNKRKRPNNGAAVSAIKSSIAAGTSGTKSKAWQAVPYRSSRTLAERRGRTGPPLAFPRRYGVQGGREGCFGAVDANGEADALQQQQQQQQQLQAEDGVIVLDDPFEELLVEGDRPRHSCVVHDSLAAPTPYNEGWEWQKQVSCVASGSRRKLPHPRFWGQTTVRPGTAVRHTWNYSVRTSSAVISFAVLFQGLQGAVRTRYPGIIYQVPGTCAVKQRTSTVPLRSVEISQGSVPSFLSARSLDSGNSADTEQQGVFGKIMSRESLPNKLMFDFMYVRMVASLPVDVEKTRALKNDRTPVRSQLPFLRYCRSTSCFIAYCPDLCPVHHECRMQVLLERHTFGTGIILTY